MAKPKRPMGEILLEMEPLMEEMVDDHDLQWGDFLSLMHSWLMVHRPDAREQYVRGGNPQFYYGPKQRKKK